MKYIALIILLTVHASYIFAQDTDCKADASNSKLNKSLELSYRCKNDTQALDTNLSYNENLKQKEKVSLAKEPHQSLKDIDAFVKPLNYNRIKTDNSDTQYQFNLDNFRVPAYSCVIPEFDDSDSAIKDYHQESIAELHSALNDHYECLLASGQHNRELFKQLITQGLDGKILSSNANAIEWTVLPKYQEQTTLVMQNINALYTQRYNDYAKIHNRLRDLIQRYNRSLISNKPSSSSQ